MSSTPTTVMVTARVWDAFADKLTATAPDYRFITIDIDGTLRDGTTVLHRDDAAADIAYASTDLFDPPHRDENIRHFFGWLINTPGLGWLHMAAAGTDNPVFASLLEGGVRVTTSHHTAGPISEYVLAQVLAHRLPLEAWRNDQASHAWNRNTWTDVSASRWLVVGLGSIGTEVAVRARAFGAHVTGVRRTPSGNEPVDEMIPPDHVVPRLADHDVIVLATPATSATEGMVDEAFLAALAPETILVNIGRGALIDENALRISLDADRPTRAVLDVTAVEPLPDDHWLWDHPKVTLTPHNSAGSTGSLAAATDVFVTNLARHVTAEPLLDEISLDDR